jgi:hypothetical protein
MNSEEIRAAHVWEEEERPGHRRMDDGCGNSEIGTYQMILACEVDSNVMVCSRQKLSCRYLLSRSQGGRRREPGKLRASKSSASNALKLPLTSRLAMAKA